MVKKNWVKNTIGERLSSGVIQSMSNIYKYFITIHAYWRIMWAYGCIDKQSR